MLLKIVSSAAEIIKLSKDFKISCREDIECIQNNIKCFSILDIHTDSLLVQHMLAYRFKFHSLVYFVFL